MSGDAPRRGDCALQARLRLRQRFSGALAGRRRDTGRRDWESFVYGHAAGARLVVGMVPLQVLKSGACMSESWRCVHGLCRIADRADQQEGEREERKRSKTAPPIARIRQLGIAKRIHHVVQVLSMQASTKLIQVKPTPPAAGRTTPRGASPQETTR